MTKSLFLTVFCLLASASSINAQLIIRNGGHAEIGHDPFDPVPEGLNPNYYNWLDTTTVLKVFGNYGEYAAGGYISFGDQLLRNSFNVNVGELRFKENVEPVEGVLSTLENLEAVSYTLKNDYAKQCRTGINNMPILTDKDSRDKDFFDQFYAKQEQGDERYGFLAQNVKEVFPQLVHTDNSGYMYVDYIGLIPILVQSINELKAKVEELSEDRGTDNAPLLAAQLAAQNEVGASMVAAKLYQNSPNPWSSETVIRYSLPQGVSKADIYIYDMQGAQLKSIQAQGRGENQVTITARDLKAGMYIYALVADGTLIDSKKMILTE